MPQAKHKQIVVGLGQLQYRMDLRNDRVGVLNEFFAEIIIEVGLEDRRVQQPTVREINVIEKVVLFPLVIVHPPQRVGVGGAVGYLRLRHFGQRLHGFSHSA